MSNKYDCLKLENQICFPLYVVSKEVIRKYTPLLEELDLTYTQYICMMALWDKKVMNVKDLGEALYLDSGTLTPLLKKLEAKNYITRERNALDERIVVVNITDEGLKLRDKALSVPSHIGSCIKLSEDDAKTLYKLLHKIMDNNLING